MAGRPAQGARAGCTRPRREWTPSLPRPGGRSGRRPDQRPRGLQQPTAEYVLGLILALAKDFPGTWEHQRRREWRPRPSDSITGRTVLVWGTGPIGRAIARLLRAVGMRVSGAGRKPRTDDPDFGTVHGTATLRSALTEADYVVLAAPLTQGTRGMVDAPVLAAMKPGARLINVGRGGLVDEEA
ncbi:NAD(P)-dependent oxidoreductase, partial [Streptomyces griseorubiginosus]